MPTILVVDDSEIDRRIAGGLLQKHGGFDVVYAADGEAALQHFEARAPDLVLTDLQMPQMDGLQLVAAVKEDFPLTPVVLMTAQGSEEIAAEALRRGAASYVPKKKLADDLIATVERVLSAAREDRGQSRLMHHLSECDCRFELPCDRSLIAGLAGFLQQLLRSVPLGDETERLRVGIALEESLKNAYYHGCLEVTTGADWPVKKGVDQIASERLREAPYIGRRIFVQARVSRTAAEFIVRDEGPGFDHSQLPDPAAPQSHALNAGRGILLMRTIMDEVRFNAAGNEVTLIKRPSVESHDMPAAD